VAALTIDVDMSEVLARVAAVLQQVTEIKAKVDTLATQAQVDALAARVQAMRDGLAAQQAALTAAVGGIRDDLVALKNANPALDLGSLNANVTAAESALAGVGVAVAGAQALDEENPPV
jgi:hypothetical protein